LIPSGYKLREALVVFSLFAIRRPLHIGVIPYAATNFPVDVDPVSLMRYDHTGCAARLHPDEHGRDALTQRRQHKSHIERRSGAGRETAMNKAEKRAGELGVQSTPEEAHQIKM